jgi:rubrerythrin
MQEKRFQKRVEDFICEKCGNEVKGNGYTDHCPECLWSKHVDINPGDRKSRCGGLMEPIGAEFKSNGYTVYYRCAKCGFKHRVKSAPKDNFEEIIKLTSRPFNKLV